MRDPNTVTLRELVAHTAWVPASLTLEQMQREFARERHDFFAVLDEGALAGVCSRKMIASLLGARFGFALFERALVHQHMLPDPLVVREDARMTEVLMQVSSRSEDRLYDDVVLVDLKGAYVGMIPMHALVRLQTRMMGASIRQLEASKREIEEKNRQFVEELRMAREVQLALMPSEIAPISGAWGSFSFAHRYEPAGGVSGDFFDVLPIGNGRAGLLVCDVMGHGVRSALVAAMVRALVEDLKSESETPAKFMAGLNSRVTRILGQANVTIFVTAAYAVVDGPGKRLRFSLAGHPAPLFLSGPGGRAVIPEGSERATGPAWGLIEDADYEECELAFGPGDRLLCYTDGIIETEGPDDVQYGVGRLGEILSSQPPGSKLADVLDVAMRDTQAFARSGALFDDRCLLAVERTAEPSPGAADIAT